MKTLQIYVLNIFILSLLWALIGKKFLVRCIKIYQPFVFIIPRIISIITVFVNKTLLSSKIVGLEAPLFVTWFQCVISALICLTMSKLAKTCPRYVSFPEGNPWNRDTARKVRIYFMSWRFYAFIYVFRFFHYRFSSPQWSSRTICVSNM